MFIQLVILISASALQINLLDLLEPFRHPGLQDSQCIQELKSLFPPNKSSSIITSMMLYSSHNVNDLGNYKACTANKDLSYIIMKCVVDEEQGSLITIALCLPNQCTTEDLLSIRPSIYQSLKKVMEAGGMNMENGNIHFNEQSIQFVNSLEESKENTKITSGTAITICLLCALLGMVIIATYLEYGNKSSNTFVSIFSAIQSVKSLFSSSNPVDQNLNVLNGVRVISIIWVVLGHSFAFASIIMAPNASDMLNTMKNKKWFAIITAAPFSVDTFFAISGFLAALSSIKLFENSENRNVRTVLKCIAMRFMRLTPLLLIAIILEVNIFSILFGGPIHNFWGPLVKQCKDYFYMNFLYINNLVSSKYNCLPWTWYLACDMQFYIYSFLITILFAIKKKWGLLAMALTAIASIVLQAILVSVYNVSTSMMRNGGDFNAVYYFKPYTRINTYLLGILLAWMYASYKNGGANVIVILDQFSSKVVNSRGFRYLMYVIGFALTTVCVFLQHLIDYYCDAVLIYQNVLYIVLSRPIFIIGLILVIYPLLLGRGKALCGVLAAPFMSPLAKLTYGIYLYHITIINTETFTLQSYLLFSPSVAFMWTCHTLLYSVVVSLATSILVECPMLKIEKSLMGLNKERYMMVARIKS